MKRKDSQSKDRGTDNRNTSTQDADRDKDNGTTWLDEHQTYGAPEGWKR